MRILALLFLALPTGLFANDWEALETPGAVAIMRHALAPGTGDPADFTLGECSTQRNLDDRGRDQARRIGQAIRERGIAVDRVLTSQWCRTRETAELLDLAPVEDAPTLNSFFRDFSRREARTVGALELLQDLDTRALLVTHQVNISALTGEGTRSGEVLVIRLNAGAVEVLGRILIDP